MQIRRLPEVAKSQLPVTRCYDGQRLDEIHEVRVRGLEVLDDGPELLRSRAVRMRATSKLKA